MNPHHLHSKRDEGAEEKDPFANVKKQDVLRDVKQYFNATNLDPVKCDQTIAKILYLLNHGEEFTPAENTDVFFAVTKLFQSQDVHLRRLVYMLLKELKVGSDESLIVGACLNKDMASKIEHFRANSIRVLSSVLEPSMVPQMERFLQQSVVHKDPFIVCATLTAGQRLLSSCPELVKRWANEVQEALNSDNKMVQYHALALLHQIRQNDRLAINKILGQLMKSPPSGNLAQTLLVRMIAAVLRSQRDGNYTPELLAFLEQALRNRSFMVVHEACLALLSLPNLPSMRLLPMVLACQELISSPVPVQRFAAVRMLSHLVNIHPTLVVSACPALDLLTGDVNRHTATLALCTILRTGAEAYIDRALKLMAGFMADLSDDLKAVLVDAIKVLNLKQPAKSNQLLTFLASCLREEGGLKFKKAIVEAVMSVVDNQPSALEMGMEHLCEFIEDCEFPELSIRILHFLAERGPTTSNPAKYIRFMFNRVTLECASVRAAAVSAMAQYASLVPSLSDNVLVLLRRCETDNDDEVRDRAVTYCNLLHEQQQKRLHDPSNPAFAPATLSTGKAKAVLAPSVFSATALQALQLSLNQYLASPDLIKESAFNLNEHLVALPEPAVAAPSSAATASTPSATTPSSASFSASSPSSSSAAAAAQASSASLSILQSIPELAALGPVFHSSAPVLLTEAETEYVVECVKHVLPQHVVLQFSVTNNMPDQQLEDVSVEVTCEDGAWREDMAIPEPIIKYQQSGQPGTCFSVFRRPASSFTSGALSCTLKFHVRDVENGEPVEGDTTEDEYQLEDLEVQESDFMRPTLGLGLPEFKRQWETLGDSNEVLKKFSLGLDSLQAAVTAVITLLGMAPCEGGGVVARDARSHGMNLAGEFFGGIPVLCRAGFMMDPKHGVTLKIAVRSSNSQINSMLAHAIR